MVQVFKEAGVDMMTVTMYMGVLHTMCPEHKTWH